MLMRLLQLAGGFAGAAIAIYGLQAKNGYIVAACFVAGAFFVTLPTIWTHWWGLRHLRRRWHSEGNRLGMLSGWKVHLPWNASKPVYSWQMFLEDQRAP